MLVAAGAWALGYAHPVILLVAPFAAALILGVGHQARTIAQNIAFDTGAPENSIEPPARSPARLAFILTISSAMLFGSIALAAWQLIIGFNGLVMITCGAGAILGGSILWIDFIRPILSGRPLR